MTSPTFRAVAFSGSLRIGSINTALVRLAQQIAPTELSIEIIDWVDQLPWMNPDLETDPPEIVQRWWRAVREADAAAGAGFTPAPGSGVTGSRPRP